MSGRLYGVSVGPGDPGLITLNALQVLKDCKVICYPSKKPGEDSVALEIARGAMSFEGKELVELVFSMDPEDSVRRASEKVALDKLCGILDRGDDVAMVVLGDIGVYSTYMYIDEAVRGR
jgi:precorrin-2/cobalt-factor-2 C20-methyltransferase